ncbi:MAG: hypothetical protein SOW08_06545 [Lachnospiraceae bacterium]|nr:hypothetical protein [Lachnospiraceae bacterium]
MLYRNENRWAASPRSIGTWNDLKEDGTCYGESATFFGTENFGFICEWDTISDLTVNSGDYIIYVVDSSGKPISGASVTFDGIKCMTDHSGAAVFSRFTVEQPEITVTCDGYKDYSNADEDYEKSAEGYEFITLYSEKESDCKLKSARYIAGLYNTNLLSETKRLSLTHSNANLLDNGKFSLKCKACDPSKAKEYALYQGNTRIASSTNGTFSNLAVSQFSKGGNVAVYVTGKDGEVVKTKINLSFTDDSSVKDTYFKISDSISFAVSSDVPFVGGTTVNMKLPADIPVELYVSDGKIYGGINIEIWNKEGKKSVSEQYKDAKKTLKQAVKAANMNLNSKTIRNDLKKLLKNKGKSTFPLDMDASLSFCGFLEGDWNENGVTKASGTAYFLLEGSAKKDFQFVTPFAVPITVQIKGEASGKLEGSIAFDFSKSVFSGNMEFSPSIGMEVFGGVGVKSVAAAGAYGSGTIDAGFSLIGTNGNFRCNTVDLTGELGAKIYFACWEGKHTFAYNTWHLYSRTNGTRSLSNGEISEENQAQVLYNMDRYELSDTSYLSGESSWNGGSSKARSSVNNEFTQLLSGTYRNSSPVLASDGEHMILAFNRADTAQNDFNQSRVSYSVFDSGSNLWSSPVGLGSEGVSSGFARIYGGEEGIYLTCLQSNQIYADDWSADMEEYASSLQVCVSRFDTETGAFEKLTVLSDDDTLYEHSAEVGILDGIPTVVWVADSNFEIYGQNSTNILRCSQYVDGAWTEPKDLVTGLNAVTGIALGSMNGTPYIAYCTDGDNDLGTEDDITLSLCSLDGSGRKIASGMITAPSFEMMADTGSESLVYVENGTLAVTANGSEVTYPLKESVANLNSTYSIEGNTLYYAAATEQSSNLFKILYDETRGVWSEPIQITDQENYLENLGIASSNGITYCTGLLKNVTITEDDVVDACDLVWKKLETIDDLCLLSAVYKQDDVLNGANLPVSLEVRNNGDSQVDTLTVKVSDEEGAEILSQEIEVNLAPSEEIGFTIELPLADDLTYGEYTWKIDNADGSIDRNEEDNIKKLGIGYCDLQLSEELIEAGNSRILTCKIENTGITASAGTLNVYAPENSEEPIYTIAVESLEKGQRQIISMDLTDSEYESGVFTVVVTADQEEFFTENNMITRSIDFTQEETEELQILIQPEDYIGEIGENAVFTITAVGEDLSYQWQYQNAGSSTWKISGQLGNKTRSLTVPITEIRDGQKYRCVVSNASGKQIISDEAVLYVKKTDSELKITSQPEDYTGEVGETAVFTVTAEGENLSYQWQYCNAGYTTWKNSGQTGNKTNTIKVPITEARDGQKYRCVITDGAGNQVISDASVLHVGSTSGSEEITITDQPKDYTGAVGETAVFTVTAAGTELSYQWQYQNAGTSVWKASGQSGNKTNTLKVPITEARDGQKYRCVITDGSGSSVTSDAAILHVGSASGSEKITITGQPEDYTGAVGETAVFTVTATGEGLTYQWQYQNVGTTVWKASGQTGNKTNTLKVPITAARNGQKYRCVVTDSSGNTVTSDAAVLYVAE